MRKNDQYTQEREHPEPEEGTLTTPKIVLAWIVILIVWGLGYYAWQIGQPMLGGDSRTAIALKTKNDVSNISTENNAKTSPDGKAIFTNNCLACHQAAGQGIPGAFPPLAGSKWVTAKDVNVTLSIVHDGLSGKIEVAGAIYNGIMPAFKSTLSSSELAAVLTYIRREWGNNAEELDASMVEKHSDSVGDRGAWTVDELKQRFQSP